MEPTKRWKTKSRFAPVAAKIALGAILVIVVYSIGHHYGVQDARQSVQEVDGLQGQLAASQSQYARLWRLYDEQCQSNWVMYRMLWQEEPRDNGNLP